MTLESGLYRRWRTEACRDRGSSRRFLTGIFDLSSIFLLCRDSRRNHIHVHEEDFAKASLLRLEFISKVISVFKPKLYLVDRQQRREEPPPRQGGRLHRRHPQGLQLLRQDSLYQQIHFSAHQAHLREDCRSPRPTSNGRRPTR